MARKGLFGRLAETAGKWLKRAFGGEEEASRQAEEVKREAPREEPPKEVPTPEEKEEASRQAELERMRSRLEPIISEANRRIELIQAHGYASAALQRAEQESGRDYFSLDELETAPQIIEEATRARVFIADKTSTIEGAKIYTAQLNAAEFRGKFGNEYHTWEHKFKNFDTSTIDEEMAKQVFSNYRKLEEIRAADITGDGAYGSENLIIAMYEAQIRGEDSFMAGLEQLDAHYRMKTTEWKSRFERANEVGDILGTVTDDGDFFRRGMFF